MNHPCNKEREINLIHAKLDKMDTKLDNLNSWKFKLMGGSFVIMLFISLLFKTKLF